MSEKRHTLAPDSARIFPGAPTVATVYRPPSRDQVCKRLVIAGPDKLDLNEAVAVKEAVEEMGGGAKAFIQDGFAPLTEFQSMVEGCSHFLLAIARFERHEALLLTHAESGKNRPRIGFICLDGWEVLHRHAKRIAEGNVFLIIVKSEEDRDAINGMWQNQVVFVAPNLSAKANDLAHYIVEGLFPRK